MCASRPTPANARGCGTCARACSRRWARCAGSGRPSSSRTSRSRCRALPKRPSRCSVCLPSTATTTRSSSVMRSRETCTSSSRRISTIAAEIERYRVFMDALCHMVVERYDGSLKAEHGTGRNIAPFVELEWGADAYRIMRAIKRLFDPRGLLNPGVLINDDRDAHLKNLKPLPECDPLVDKCIECGFCEPKCPSHKLTLSPRQRIVGWREIRRLERDGAQRRATRDDARAVRLPRDRHLRRVRTVRDRLSGRDRDGPADQGAARTARGRRRTARSRMSPPSISALSPRVFAPASPSVTRSMRCSGRI